MRVAVTGASGMIGTAVSEALVQRGDEPIPVTRRPTSGPHVDWDPRAETIDVEALRGIDAVIHLAGEGIAEKRWTDDHKAELLESRVRGTSTIARALADLGDSGPRILVSASAIGYYGDRGDAALDESSSPGDDFLADLCQRWEQAADRARDAGVRVAHPRIGIVQSTKGGALGTQLPLFRLGLGGPIGPGTQWVSWIHIDDAVAALLHLVDNDISGPANLTAPNPATNANHARALGRALHRPAILRPPKLALHLKLGKELTQALLLNSARVLPRVLERGGFTFTYPELDAALQDLVDD